MEGFDSSLDLLSSISRNKLTSNLFSDKEKILCKHCKRTASNGIRCLGMCVADNDY
tara:strand:- start:2576 stop:2743 length:168 start_codon:yes stop_codon:yes gene_type:complete